MSIMTDRKTTDYYLNHHRSMLTFHQCTIVQSKDGFLPEFQKKRRCCRRGTLTKIEYDPTFTVILVNPVPKVDNKNFHAV